MPMRMGAPVAVCQASGDRFAHPWRAGDARMTAVRAPCILAAVPAGVLPMKRILLAAMLAVLGATAMAQTPSLPQNRSPAGAKVYFIAPRDGATVGREVVVRFGLVGMGVAPAGVAKEQTGHHHLLVDVTDPPLAGQP